MKTKNSPRVIFTVVCLITMIANYALRPSMALAFAGSGQLTFARQVTINGNNAVSGQTVFDGNRIKVGGKGTAIINLGKSGRIELGANSEMALFVSGNNLSGTLMSGCLAVNAPAGESVEINTPKGKISSASNQPTSFFVGFKGNSANIFPNLGEIKVSADSKVENAKRGDLITLTSGPNGISSLKRLAKGACGDSGAMCACDSESLPQTTNPNPPGGSAPKNGGTGNSPSPGMLALLFGAMGASTALMFGLSGDNGGGLTCVNTTGFFCKAISPTTP